MPWKETRVMDEKIRMISNWLSGEYSIMELSQIHEVSRKTLYKWIEQYEADQESCLHERARRPLTMPSTLRRSWRAEILASKGQHEHWGSRKVLAWLRKPSARKELARCQYDQRNSEAPQDGPCAA